MTKHAIALRQHRYQRSDRGKRKRGNVLIRFLSMRPQSIQRIHDPQRLLGLLQSFASYTNKFLFRLAAERESMNNVAEIVLVAVLQVWHQVVHVHCIGLEGSSR